MQLNFNFIVVTGRTQDRSSEREDLQTNEEDCSHDQKHASSSHALIALQYPSNNNACC